MWYNPFASAVVFAFAALLIAWVCAGVGVWSRRWWRRHRPDRLRDHYGYVMRGGRWTPAVGATDDEWLRRAYEASLRASRERRDKR